MHSKWKNIKRIKRLIMGNRLNKNTFLLGRKPFVANYLWNGFAIWNYLIRFFQSHFIIAIWWLILISIYNGTNSIKTYIYRNRTTRGTHTIWSYNYTLVTFWIDHIYSPYGCFIKERARSGIVLYTSLTIDKIGI